jgi:hypothetical protein
MQMPEMPDNTSRTVKDDLAVTVSKGDKLSIAAACFSIYADDYEKNRNYWKYLKAKLKREGNQVGSVTTQFKFAALDGKKRAANVLDYDPIRPTILFSGI